MSDLKTARMFAKFIDQRFPKQPVADVAGGNGFVQQALRELEWDDVTTYDLKPRPNKNNRNLKMVKGKLPEQPKQTLIIGMHPDGATLEILNIATENDLSFVICPCCAIMPNGDKFKGGDWRKFLRSKAIQKSKKTVQTHTMKFKGKNYIICGG